MGLNRKADACLTPLSVDRIYNQVYFATLLYSINMPLPEIETTDHFPYVTRSLLRLYEEGHLSNVTAIDVEPDYGYVARVSYSDGSHRITYGNDLGLNTGAACDLAKDKGHSKFMLRTIGVNCPKGEEFLLPWWAERIGPTQIARGNFSIRTTEQAFAYIEEGFGYPVYVKPVDGSKGGDIYKVGSADDLSTAFSTYNEKRIRVAMVEEPLLMPDFRLVSLDGDLISAYQRIPLAVIGDGERTIERLIVDKQTTFESQGRDTKLDAKDPRIEQFLRGQGLTLDFVPAPSELRQLVAISNLSAGGTSVDVTEEVNPRWVKLAAFVAENFNLRLCGLDLACVDITEDDVNYSVIEVNAAPGLDHYAMSGEAQAQLVDRLYTRVLNAFPHAIPPRSTPT